MSKVTVSLAVRGGRVMATGTPFTLRDTLKALPGARAERDWAKAFIGWSYPLSPVSAAALVALFPDAQRDAEVDTLIAAHGQQERAQQHKVADTPPDIPLVKTTPWRHQARAFWYVVELWGDKACPREGGDAK